MNVGTVAQEGASTCGVDGMEVVQRRPPLPARDEPCADLWVAFYCGDLFCCRIPSKDCEFDLGCCILNKGTRCAVGGEELDAGEVAFYSAADRTLFLSSVNGDALGMLQMRYSRLRALVATQRSPGGGARAEVLEPFMVEATVKR